jgi:hypothetical protein
MDVSCEQLRAPPAEVNNAVAAGYHRRHTHMKRLLVAVALAGLTVTPTLHLCCVADTAGEVSSPMPACHHTKAEAGTAVVAPTTCSHDSPLAVATQVLPRTEATAGLAGFAALSWRHAFVAVIYHPPAISVSPPSVSGVVPLRI